MRPPPTGTVTFLFTDIEGSTKLWDQSPDAMRPALIRHDALLRQAILRNGGFVFKTIGDAFCAAFATAPEALAAALAAQHALAAEPWGTEMPLRARIALHTGSAEERDGDYFGPPLNRVARLLAIGHGGQTLLSLATQELTRDALPIDATLRDLGNARLKDLARPEHVFQLLHPSLIAEFPPLRSLNNPNLPNNLPQQATSFVGREKEVAEVKALLEKTRLLTLTGTGGAGKTRLSLQVAADLLDGTGDGVWLVELASLGDPALVPQAVAQVLGIQEHAGQLIQKTLVDTLKSKCLLLILDNCEHVIAACASLATDLMRSCPEVNLLASSREPLNVAGEQTYRVPPLSLPDSKAMQTVESLTQYEAARLFIERARAVQSVFTVTDANAPAVAQVCFHLDGIPLAIELAAARVRSLSVEEINARLDQRFRLFTGGARTLLPRQQTLRALIDWSYDLLTEQEKALLGRLSVFESGWPLDASEAVCAGEDPAGAVIEAWEVLDLLTGLVDKSLVGYEDQQAGAGRYRLLETVRQYASDRLGEKGDAAARQEQAASWFLALAAEAASHLTGPDQATWLRRLETEHDNLRAGLSWYDRAESAEPSLRFVASLNRFWVVRGHYYEGRQWSDKALQKAHARIQERDAEESEAQLASPLARASFGAGYLAFDQGDYSRARALYQESLAIYRRLGYHQGITAMLDNLGNVAYYLGDYPGARASYEESLALARQSGSQPGIASSLGNLGNVALELGDYLRARELHEACITIQRQLGNEQGIANSLNNLGVVAHRLSDYSAARDLHKASLAIQRQLENQRGIANSLTNLGHGHHALGDESAARAFYAEGLTIRSRLGNQDGIADSLEAMAQIASAQGQALQSVRLFGAAAALRESAGVSAAPDVREGVDTATASAREALGEEAFAAAWETGRAMTPEQAASYALGKTERRFEDVLLGVPA